MNRNPMKNKTESPTEESTRGWAHASLFPPELSATKSRTIDKTSVMEPK